MDDSTVEIAVASVGVAGTLAAAPPTQVLAQPATESGPRLFAGPLGPRTGMAR